jgi:hypothetical protein|tara:strand:- start:153 stop:425 length:273 start_codon:yes stop_codon:yes gene_type:complete
MVDTELQDTLNLIVGFIPAEQVKEIIDYYWDAEDDEVDYTSVFKILDEAFTDWTSHAYDISDAYLTEVYRLKRFLTLTKNERVQLRRNMK